VASPHSHSHTRWWDCHPLNDPTAMFGQGPVANSPSHPCPILMPFIVRGRCFVPQTVLLPPFSGALIVALMLRRDRPCSKPQTFIGFPFSPFRSVFFSFCSFAPSRQIFSSEGPHILTFRRFPNVHWSFPFLPYRFFSVKPCLNRNRTYFVLLKKDS